jgi:cytochrome c peroxidase
MLFLDDRLSAAGTLSCASCHQPSQGWGDGLDISFGFPPGTPRRRNSQTIINSRYLPKLFWAGEKSSLDAQAKSAFSGIAAQNLDSILAEERLRQIPEYVELFREAFGGEPSFDDALYAVAAFESTINSTNVPFDAYLQGDASALSESALRGVELFVGQARCSVCHSGPLLTDNSFHAIGVPDNSRFGTDPLRQVTLRYQNSARGVPEDVYRTVDSDLRLSYVTKQDIDKGKFRTPMLLEVGQNGPYMHNGVFETLEGVVKFYNVGGGNAENKSPVIEPLDLDDQEIADLVAFLGAVTGDEILVDAPELPDY